MVRAALRREISRLRVSSKRFPSASYRHASPLEMTMLASTSGHAFGVRVQRVHKVQRVQRGRLTALRAEGCGRLSAAGCVPTGETTHYILCVAPLLQNVLAVHRFAQGATALRAEGDGGALRAQIIKKAPPFPSFRPQRSGVENPPSSDGTGGIMAGDLSTQSIMGAVPVCLPYRHVPPLEMTMLASAPPVISTQAGQPPIGKPLIVQAREALIHS